MPDREHTEPVELRDLVSSLSRHWTDQPVEFVRNFSNLVYRIPGHPPAYLRITKEAYRSRAEIESELAMIRHLGASGVPAGQPIAARDGEIIHPATANGIPYSACVFTEAPGVSLHELPSPDLKTFFLESGRLMGRLHKALTKFERPRSFIRRPWADDRWVRFAELVPKKEVEAWELFTELRTWIDGLPTDSSGFGLIHGDFTIMNLRIAGPQITLFDFADSCDHWHAYEIACFLHLFGARDPATRELAYTNVLAGYAEARPVTAAMIEQIPLWGKMRLLFSFLIFAQEWGFENLTPDQEAYYALRRKLFQAPPTWPGKK